jgi:hypothetical protein
LPARHVRAPAAPIAAGAPKEPSVHTATTPTTTAATTLPAAPRWRHAYALTGAAFALALLAQTFLAGGGFFSGPAFWPMHQIFGMVLSLVPLALLALAFVARLPRRDIGQTALLLGLALLQPLLPAFPARLGVPLVAALHPVNALLLFALALRLSLRAWRGERG